jgi:hypothetical protein
MAAYIEGVNARRTLIWAVVLAWMLEHVVPFGQLVLYPFTLLATWVHETGHGLVALATGGRFERLAIFADASGWAEVGTTSPGRAAAVALGGLWAPPLVGALLLAFARGPRRARTALLVMAALMLPTAVVWVRSPVGLVTVPLTAALLVWVALRASPGRRVLFTQFVAITLALDTVGRLVGYALSSTAHVGGHEQKSDVAAIADAVGGHYLAWGLVVIVVAMALLALGLWAAWRAPKSAPTARRAPASRR